MDEFGEHPEKLIETQSSLNWPSSAIKPFESGSCSALWQSFAKSIFLWPSRLAEEGLVALRKDEFSKTSLTKNLKTS